MKIVVTILALSLWGCALAQAQQGAPLLSITIHEGEGLAPLPCTPDASQPQYFDWVNNTGHAIGIVWSRLSAFTPEDTTVYGRLFIKELGIGSTITQDAFDYSGGYWQHIDTFGYSPYYDEVAAGQTLTLKLNCLAAPTVTTAGGNVRIKAVVLP